MAEPRRISISLRVTPRFKRCLELAARADSRSQTNLIEKLLFDHCRRLGLDPDVEHGALPASASNKDTDA